MAAAKQGQHTHTQTTASHAATYATTFALKREHGTRACGVQGVGKAGQRSHMLRQMCAAASGSASNIFATLIEWENVARGSAASPARHCICSVATAGVICAAAAAAPAAFLPFQPP